ncbi:MAG: SURF1 family protein [Legionellales bacterium]|nr:SURF1 family protein [Legionellales bacterium]
MNKDSQSGATSSRLRFTPSIGLTLLFLIFFTVFIALGIWQINRYHQKKQLQITYQNRAQQPSLTLNDLNTNPSSMRYSPLSVTGFYQNQYTLFLDNIIHQHRMGYYVFTLFKPNSGDQWLLINRGWIQASLHREQLPQIPPITNIETVQGIIDVPSRNPYALGKAAENPGQWPLRITYLDLSELTHLLPHPVYPFILLLNKNAEHGFVRDWKPVTRDPNKHLGYAFQWFAFAVVLLCLYIGLNIHRTEDTLNEST